MFLIESALNLPELTVNQDELFNKEGDQNPHTVVILLDEFDSEQSPYYSGLTLADITPQDKIQIYAAIGNHLLKAYEDAGQRLWTHVTNASKWTHSDRRRVLETAIRLFLRSAPSTATPPDISFHLGKAYLYRSRIIRPKGFSIPAKKIETLRNALGYFEAAKDPLAPHYRGVTALELERCDVRTENELLDVLKDVEPDLNQQLYGDDLQQQAEYLQIRVRLEELRSGWLGDRLVDTCNTISDKVGHLEKMKVVLQADNGKFKKTAGFYRNELLRVLASTPFSHPLWEDTVRFLGRICRMSLNNAFPSNMPENIVQKIQQFWGELALALWETAETTARQLSALHLRWYWARQRDLYDMAFLAALNTGKWQQAAAIADSAKNRPALTWQAMEQMGSASEEVNKDFIEEYARALAGGYITGLGGAKRVEKSTPDNALFIERTPKGTLIVQFYLVHFQTCDTPDTATPARNGYALMCDETGWRFDEAWRFDYEAIWRAFLKWQTLYFDLPSGMNPGQRIDSAHLMKNLCKQMGESLEFLFSLKSSVNIDNLILVTHDFLHRLPIHGAIRSGNILLNTYNCRFLPSLPRIQNAADGYFAEDTPSKPVWLQYEQSDSAVTSLFDEYFDDEKLDSKRSSLYASAADMLSLSTVSIKFLLIFCHGKADMVNPFYSKLLLKDPLRVIDIESHCRFLQTHIFLGSCETDLYSQLDTPIDEHITMASSLLNCGAATVAGAMWEARADRVLTLLDELMKLSQADFSVITAKQREWCLKNLNENNDPELMTCLCFRIWGTADL